MVNDSRLILKGIALRVISVDGRIWATEVSSDLSLQNLKVFSCFIFFHYIFIDSFLLYFYN